MGKRQPSSQSEQQRARAPEGESSSGLTESAEDWVRRYEAAVRSGPLILYDWDLARGTVTWSGEAEAILGYRTDEMGDADWAFGQIHADDLPRIQDEAARIKASATPARLAYRVRHRDGRYISIEDSVSVLPNATGTPARLIGFITDVTEKKRAEEHLQRLNESLEWRVAERTRQIRRLATDLNLAEQRERQRLAALLHDHLQQLLVAARLRIDTIQREFSDRRLQEYVELLQEVVDEATKTCRTLAGQLDPPKLHEGLVASIDWLAEWMQDKYGLIVTIDADGAAEPFDPTVRAFLFEIVRESLFNVVKHARVSNADVRLRRTETDEIEILISDKGVGFATHSSAPGKAATEGFGIPSIRHRLELLGGSLAVDSSSETGTRIRVCCPRDPSSEASERSMTPELAPLAGPHHIKRHRPGPRSSREES